MNVKDLTETNSENIRNKIHTIRGVQVLLDRDLAKLYCVETRVLKQAVNRNKKRFPSDFMFVLTSEEIDSMVSQSVIPSKKHLGGARPYAFTEQGIANLSTLLNTKMAVDVNIHIIRAFVSMRKVIFSNAQIFHRLDYVEKKQIEHNDKFEEIFDKLQNKYLKPDKGIFFDGQVFDAYTFVSDLIRSANKSIILVDNFVDDSVFTLFTKRKKNVKVIIYTKELTKQLDLDLEKYNSQYEEIKIKEFKKTHDRFLIIDDKEIYHIGASLKDLGKKWFAFSKFNDEVIDLVRKLKSTNRKKTFSET